MRCILKWAWMWWQFICSKPSAQRWENGFSQTHHLNLSLQMQVWISFIETLYWINPTHSSWSEKHMHQRRLKNCTVSMLCDMRKTHKHIVDRRSWTYVSKKIHKDFDTGAKNTVAQVQCNSVHFLQSFSDWCTTQHASEHWLFITE
jgi:hypothetical protein